jgi:hypothetical protein
MRENGVAVLGYVAEVVVAHEGAGGEGADHHHNHRS